MVRTVLSVSAGQLPAAVRSDKRGVQLVTHWNSEFTNTTAITTDIRDQNGIMKYTLNLWNLHRKSRVDF